MWAKSGMFMLWTHTHSRPDSNSSTPLRRRHDVVENPLLPPIAFTPEVSSHCDSSGHLKMAESLAAHLAAQEEQIRFLTREISTLRDELTRGLDKTCVATPSPELESLRTENEKLRYRLLHLRRGLQAELELEGAQGKTQQGAKCGRAPEKNHSKEKQANNRVDNKVVTETEGAYIYQCKWLPVVALLWL